MFNLEPLRQTVKALGALVVPDDLTTWANQIGSSSTSSTNPMYLLYYSLVYVGCLQVQCRLSWSRPGNGTGSEKKKEGLGERGEREEEKRERQWWQQKNKIVNVTEHHNLRMMGQWQRRHRSGKIFLLHLLLLLFLCVCVCVYMCACAFSRMPNPGQPDDHSTTNPVGNIVQIEVR